MTAVQTCVNILPDMMARNQQNLARDEASASDLSHGFIQPSGISFVSLYQTGPSRDNTRGSSWNGGRGQQYFRGASRRDTQSRYPESFSNVSENQDSSAEFSLLMNLNRGSGFSASNVASESVAMSRWASQESFQSAGQGTSHGADIHTQDSPVMEQTFHQMAFPLLTGNHGLPGSADTTLYSNSPQFEEFTHQESALFSPAESFDAFEPASGSQQRTPVSGDVLYGLFNAGPEDVSFNPHIDIQPSLIPATVSEASFSASSLLSEDASLPWDRVQFQDSAASSPHFANEAWPINPHIVQSSPVEDSISDFKALSPRVSKKVPDDEASSHLTRQTAEENTARDHPFYHTAVPDPKDKLYHCPWEGDPSCTHKPEKLKCNYDKFVDSHLKPYRCTKAQCENSRFSSTACLLRHEREAHAMHGHGDKPYLCTHEGCERGVPGNGFPRHWNLRDHMKRVHNDLGPVPRSNASGGSPTPSNSAPTRAPRKRKNDTTAADKEKEPAKKRAQTSSIKGPSPSPVLQTAAPMEPSLIEQWQQRKNHLLQLVSQLDDPTAPGIMQVLSSAGKELQVLAGTSRRINNAPAMKRTVSQQSGE